MSQAALSIKDLTVRFADHLALDDVSLDIPGGAVVSIVGPNGSGKSTLLRVVLGLIRPVHGSVRVFGETPAGVPPDWIGYVPQVKTLDRHFPARSIELVATGILHSWPMRLSREIRRQALSTMERVGAAHLAERPLGRLSGGELQRIYLARSLIRHPRLIMLDEPSTGIDAVGEADMYRLLDDFQKGSGGTILMVTHDLDAAYYHSSHVLLLNRRRIGFGEPAKALTDSCLRRTFGHMGHSHSMDQGGCELHD